MATKWTGTIEERYARLDRANRRCDGNQRRCPLAAQIAYDLYPATDGTVAPDATLDRKRACSRHARQFSETRNYVVTGSMRLSNERPEGKAHPHTVYTEIPA